MDIRAKAKAKVKEKAKAKAKERRANMAENRPREKMEKDHMLGPHPVYYNLGREHRGTQVNPQTKVNHRHPRVLLSKKRPWELSTKYAKTGYEAIANMAHNANTNITSAS